ncbi:MAG: RNA polymerase subunit sigma-24, partial [Syntrophobacteraceae bacterium]|nr:RNA polymerase subunit sigma-24 [Syntrophobacteraceae bacterium]
MPGLTIDLNVYADEKALLAGLLAGDKLACPCLVKRYSGQM